MANVFMTCPGHECCNEEREGNNVCAHWVLDLGGRSLNPLQAHLPMDKGFPLKPHCRPGLDQQVNVKSPTKQRPRQLFDSYIRQP